MYKGLSCRLLEKNAMLVIFTFKLDATIKLLFVSAVQKQSTHSIFETALSPVHSVACTGAINVAFETNMQNMCVRYV